MRSARNAGAAPPEPSPGDGFERGRHLAGLIAGHVLFAIVLLIPAPNMPPDAHKLAAAMVLMIVLWMTEALPLPITALIGPTLAVLMGVTTASVAFAPFADPIIFLFIGSFMLAEAMFVHRLDRRLAFTALASAWIGQSALRLVVVYAMVGCVISMWMSNTATTAMLFPLGLAVLAELGRGRATDPRFMQYAMGMMLVTSFAASIGGLGTPVGTPPNLIGKALLAQAGVAISFPGWMLLGVPILIVMMAFVILWLLVPGARHLRLGDDARAAVRTELRALGPISVGERNVLVAFGLTVMLWVIPGLCQAIFGQTHPISVRLNAAFPESVAAILGALLLFLIPVDWRARRFTLSWDEASRIDWGIVLLFGGGLAMGKLADSTGLSAALGQWVIGQFPGIGTVGLTLVFTGVAILLSEAASNTAAANIIVPTAIAVAKAAGVSPLEPALGATLGASMGFMMPISTPPNAIVYSSGHIPLMAMIRKGIVLDVVGYIIIVAAVLLIAPLLR